MTSTLLVQATVTIPGAIIGEAVLSFLGLGVQPPTPSWGVMLQDAQPYLSQAPRLAVSPGSRSCSRRSRSTCSATGCATCSIRGRRADAGRAARGRGPLRPVRHRRRAVHAVDRVSFTLARGRGARDRRRVRLRQERDVHGADCGCCPRPRRVSGAARLRRRSTCSPCRRGGCARSAGARSRWCSRSR